MSTSFTSVTIEIKKFSIGNTDRFVFEPILKNLDLDY